MIRRLILLLVFVLASAAAKCSLGDDTHARDTDPEEQLPPDQREAHRLGREVFELVDRALAYRSSHRGRPAATLTQMGVESLTPATVRRMVNVQREPLITVAFRKTDGRQILSCYGDGSVLEDASTSGGRFTVTCTTSAGAKRSMEVAVLPER
jgi:hypothetical protein